jgi:hypothetical protein
LHNRYAENVAVLSRHTKEEGGEEEGMNTCIGADRTLIREEVRRGLKRLG